MSTRGQVRFIYDHVFDLEKVREISNNNEWIHDSIPVNLNTSHTKIINQNEKMIKVIDQRGEQHEITAKMWNH